jgi:hypothetical protein
VHDGAVVLEATVKLPLRMVNRHGLIAGATGTGKTKTRRARSCSRKWCAASSACSRSAYDPGGRTTDTSGEARDRNAQRDA